MKILTVSVFAALAVSGFAAAYAADANDSVVTRDFTDTVVPAQQAAYEAGEKAWNACLRQHGFKYNVVALQHATGNTYTYAYEIGPYTWADFDAMHSIENTCDAKVRAQLNPHLEHETSIFFVDEPDLSHLGSGGLAAWHDSMAPFLYVQYFTLKHGRAAREAFTSAVKKITQAAARTNSPIHYRALAVQGGDDGAPDYVLVIGRKDWADYGALGSPWKMVEGAYGKAAADAIRESLDGSIASTSDHVDSYNADLSYLAGK